MESDPRKRLQQAVAHGEQLRREVAYQTARLEQLAPLLTERGRLNSSFELAQQRLQIFERRIEHEKQMATMRAQLHDLQRQRAELNEEPSTGHEDVQEMKIQKTFEHIEAEREFAEAKEALDEVRGKIAEAEKHLKNEYGIN